MHEATKLRVLSIPGRRTATQYVTLFCESLEEQGVVVVDVDSSDAAMLRFDVLHLHFPHFYIVEKGPISAIAWFVAFAAAFCAIKILGKKIVYQVHDVTPFHFRNARLLWPFLDMIHRCSDGFVFLNVSSQATFYERNPGQVGKPFIMLGHASYPVSVLGDEARAQLRAELLRADDALLVGYLGFRQARKGLDVVTMLPERTSSGRPVELLVAGEVQAAFAQESEAILSQVPSHMITVRNSRLSDEDLHRMIQSVDVVLLPYRMGWNSGMALMILSNRSRCLGTDLPMFKDLVAAVGAPWVYTFASEPDAVAQFQAAIDDIARMEPTVGDKLGLEQYLRANSFARGAARIEVFYRSLVNARRLRAEAPLLG